MVAELGEAQATDVVEEYLETIYKLQSKEGEVAKTSDLTRSLKVVPGTVTNTIERLEKEGYVLHEPYRGVRLTEKGRNMALQVVRRHRLSERLLTDILHVDLSKAHEVACKIEHDIADEEIMGKIEEALGNPKTCPHGNPIPAGDGKLSEEEQVEELTPLTSLEVSDSAIVERYSEDDQETLDHISSIGLKPGDEVEVMRKEPDGGVAVRLGHGTIHVLGKKMAAEILVLKTRTLRTHTIRNHRERSPRILGAEFGEYES
jgi:DtxR family Mn-dependent transcriptional regulator